MKYNNDFRYDLKVGQIKEKELGNILKDKTIEIKYDKKALETGNIFVEYESRNKASGISISESDYYCYILSYKDDTTYHIIPTSILKNRCRYYLETNRDVVGGDNNTSKGILLPINKLM